MENSLKCFGLKEPSLSFGPRNLEYPQERHKNMG